MTPTPRPPQRPPEPPEAPLHLPGAGAVSRALLRHLTGRALGRCSTALRAAADALTRLRWRLEDTSARSRAVGRRRPGTVPSGYAQGRGDIQLTINPAPLPQPVVRWLPRPDR
jgi:hypothetical protein